MLKATEAISECILDQDPTPKSGSWVPRVAFAYKIVMWIVIALQATERKRKRWGVSLLIRQWKWKVCFLHNTEITQHRKELPLQHYLSTWTLSTSQKKNKTCSFSKESILSSSKASTSEKLSIIFTINPPKAKHPFPLLFFWFRHKKKNAHIMRQCPSTTRGEFNSLIFVNRNPLY